jgi:hypothetical protein
MPIDRAGPLLLTTRAQGYRPLGFGGEPIHVNYRKLAAVIESRLGPEAARYLARPEVDEASHSIGWHATCEGNVRRWSDLGAEEQAALKPGFMALRDRFRGLAQELETAGGDAPGSARESFGHALRLALRSPGLDSLFFVGDQPVLALWGFEGGPGGFDTLAFDLTPVAAPLPATPVGPVIGVVAATGRPWWRWLLWLLGLLLLLLLLLLFLRSCLDVRVPVIEQLLPERWQAVPETVPVLPGGGTTVVPGGETVEPGAVVTPEGGVAAPSAGGESGAPASGNATTPGTGAGGPAPENPPATPPGPEAQPSEPSPPPQPEQPAPDQQQAPPEQPPAQQPPTEPAPQPGNPPPPADGLKIPPPQQGGNAQDLGFLQGEWRSKSGLFDKATGQPLTQVYRFDGQGKGTVTIRRADAVECKGAAQATRTPNGGLRIEDQGPVVCPDGRSYSPSVTECARDASGTAACTGVNEAGSTYRVEIQR